MGRAVFASVRQTGTACKTDTAFAFDLDPRNSSGDRSGMVDEAEATFRCSASFTDGTFPAADGRNRAVFESENAEFSLDKRDRTD